MRNLLLTSILVTMLCSACSKREEIKPMGLDYYPTEKDSKWIYASDQSSGGGLLSTQAEGDIALDGKEYAIIGGTNPLHNSSLLVRKENGRYYGRRDYYGIYSPEYIFLQDNLPVGSSWTIPLSTGKEVYTIVSIDQRRTIAGKEYTNTIEVKTEYYYNDQLTIWYVQKNLYAKGIGVVATSFDSRSHSSQLILKEYEIK